MALIVPEMCFWPAKTLKNLKFLRWIYVLDLVPNCCSDIKEGNWIQLLSYFIVLLNVAPSFIGMSFLVCRSVCLSKFCCIAMLRKRLHMDSKNDLTTNGMISHFFFVRNKPLLVNFISAWTEIWKNCSIIIVFWRRRSFRIVGMRGILVCSLKLPVLFSHRVL